jgi:hypothetical protein
MTIANPTSQLEQYMLVVSGNTLFNSYQERWQFYLESYMGGDEYRRAGHLVKYQLETEGEYQARLQSTPLDNHCKSVISTYISFLFRECPERELGDLVLDASLDAFMKDADLEGRSLDNFMKQVAVWANVFGHCWLIMTKPNIGAVTRADELAAGVRPYVNLVTPLTVMDWTWSRGITGAYELEYLKYMEETSDDVSTYKEWTRDSITTYVVNNRDKVVINETVEVNGLGVIPAVQVYVSRSPVRGIGISSISDIADQQRAIYNEYSEIEQLIRLQNHPALVKTADVEAGAGAGAIIQMPDNMDGALKPYLLEPTGNGLSHIYESINNRIGAIDKMANTGTVRATESRNISGVAMRTEFELLNARLSEMADNLELAEEQMWRFYCMYQGYTWNGEIDYPDNFNIRDHGEEMAKLSVAKTCATDPRVLQIIDHEVIELLGEDADIIMPETATLINGTVVPADSTKPYDEPEQLFDPATGAETWAMSFEQKRALMSQGWVCKD